MPEFWLMALVHPVDRATQRAAFRPGAVAAFAAVNGCTKTKRRNTRNMKAGLLPRWDCSIVVRVLICLWTCTTFVSTGKDIQPACG